MSSSFEACKVPTSSPLRKIHDLFWTFHASDEGIADENRFHGLVDKGKIDMIAPTHARGYVESGIDESGSPTVTVETTDGRFVKANAVITCTGYSSSWTKLFDEDTLDYLGLNPCPIPTADMKEFDYVSLSKPPPARSTIEPQRPALYRGLIPAKNILNHDFAVNGTVFSSNFGYTTEMQAHWISSYFLEDSFLKLPPSPEEAKNDCDRMNIWYEKRFPGALVDMNLTYSGFPFLNWPQAADEMMEDMGLPSRRSGGNWLTWPFKIVDTKEIEHLHEERAAKRAETQK